MNKRLFLLLNLAISSNLLFIVLFFIVYYSILCAYSLKPDGEPLGMAVYIIFFFMIFVWLSKVSIFIILAHKGKQNSYISQFFDRIKFEKNFRYKILLIAILCDYLFHRIVPAVLNFAGYILKDLSSVCSHMADSYGLLFPAWLGGVFVCYLSLVVWFWITKRLGKQKNIEQHNEPVHCEVSGSSNFIYILFWILNLFFTPITPILILCTILIFSVFSKMASFPVVSWKIFLFVFAICVMLIFYIARFFIFPLIYKYSRNRQIIRFFDRIKNECKFRKKVFTTTFLVDISMIILFLSEVPLSSIKNYIIGFIFFTVLGGGGVLMCYLSLVVWFWITKRLGKVP